MRNDGDVDRQRMIDRRHGTDGEMDAERGRGLARRNGGDHVRLETRDLRRRALGLAAVVVVSDCSGESSHAASMPPQITAANTNARAPVVNILKPSASYTNRRTTAPVHHLTDRVLALPAARVIATGWADRPSPTAARTGRRCAAPRSARRRTTGRRAETPDRASGSRSMPRDAGCAGERSASTSVSSAKSNSPNNS